MILRQYIWSLGVFSTILVQSRQKTGQSGGTCGSSEHSNPLQSKSELLSPSCVKKVFCDRITAKMGPGRALGLYFYVHPRKQSHRSWYMLNLLVYSEKKVICFTLCCNPYLLLHLDKKIVLLLRAHFLSE